MYACIGLGAVMRLYPTLSFGYLYDVIIHLLFCTLGSVAIFSGRCKRFAQVSCQGLWSRYNTLLYLWHRLEHETLVTLINQKIDLLSNQSINKAGNCCTLFSWHSLCILTTSAHSYLHLVFRHVLSTQVYQIMTSRRPKFIKLTLAKIYLILLSHNNRP